MASERNSGMWGLVALTAIVGGLVAVPLLDRRPASAAVVERIVDLDQRLADIERRLADAQDAARDVPPRLEPPARGHRASPPGAPVASPAGRDPAAMPLGLGDAKHPKPPDADETSALFALLDAYLAQRASTEEQERLFATLRDGHTVTALLAHLQGQVAADPDDLAARMRLAHAYLAKLFTVPAGPEMGVWGRKAEAQWTEVLARDDRHWEARFRRGMSYAYYPDVAGKTPAAIREFETLREQQEAGPPVPRQVGVYTMLAALYRRHGDVDRAVAVMEAGRRRHPDAPEFWDADEGR